MKRTITSLLQHEYKDYVEYVCYNRAIPSIIDGFKPSQRKAFHIVKNINDFIKVQAVAGKMISDCNYNHGDASASDAVSRMAQDFVGSNNIPVFKHKGSFGSKFIKKPSAPRYIYVKQNTEYNKFFKDFEICNPNSDMENPEPEFFLPIIPTILLNGTKGIAVGFATEIQPYNIEDIKNYIQHYINNETLVKLNPFYKGYKGKINFDKESGKYIQHGIFKIVNSTKIKITEIPTCFNREKYTILLEKLKENKHIKSYVDASKKSWDITILLSRKSKIFNDPEKHLKLTSVLNENITVIDDIGNIRKFDSVYELIEYFIEFRLVIYKKRIQYMLNKLKNEILLSRTKIKFVLEMNSINFKKMTKQELNDHFLNIEFDKEHLEKCLQLQTHQLNIDFLRKMKDLIEDLKKEYLWYKEITPSELYLLDLKEI